jgi:hypothetical protein
VVQARALADDALGFEFKLALVTIFGGACRTDER